MTDIVKGLFGYTPEELTQQRADQLNTQASAFAQMSPEARASYSLYRGGNQLAGAVGGMLGGQDPQMKKSADLQGILQGGDYNTVEGATAMAKQAAALGYGAEAQQMYAKAAELQKAASEAKLKEAQAGYYTNRGEAAMKKAKEGGAGGIGKVNPGLYTAESVQAYADSIDSGTPDYSLLVPRNPIAKAQALSPAGKQASEEGLAPGSPEFIARIKVINEAKGDKPLAPALVKDAADTAQKIASLQASGAKLDVLIPTIQQMDLGLVSNFFRSGAAALGINTEDRNKFDALKRTVLGEANKLLLLAKGTQTEGDAQRAYDQIVSSDTWKNADALTYALTDLQNTHKAAITELQARQSVVTQGNKPASQLKTTPAPAAQPAATKDYAAAFERAKAANPAWRGFTLEQFIAKAKADAAKAKGQ